MKIITLAKKQLLPLAIIGITAVLLLFLLFFNRSPESKVVKERSWNVAGLDLKAGSYHPTIILHGVTESPRNTTLEAAVRADVLKTPYLEGMKVKKNDVIIQLDDREATYLVQQRQAEVKDFQAQLTAEKNRHARDKESLKYEQGLYDLAKRAVGRQRTLVERKVGSQSAMDRESEKLRQQELTVANRQLAIKDHQHRLAQVQAKLDKANALLNQAKLDLERTQIKAPFNGRITKLNVAVGNRVQPGEALVKIYDTDAVELRAQIPTQYTTTLYQAHQEKLPLNAVVATNNLNLKLQLMRIAGEVEQGQGGVDGLFTVIDKNTRLPIGQAMELILALPIQQHVYKIPMTALYGKNRVYLVKNNRLSSLIINRVGLIHYPNGKIEALIRSDKLKDGETLITTQLPNARSGLKVSVTKNLTE